MKKLAIAGLLAAALSLTALSQQRAAAWGGGFNFSVGVTISANWNCYSNCCPPSCDDSSSYPSWGYPDYGSYGAYAAPQAAPTPAPTPAPVAPTAAVQNAAYYYPAGYGYYPVPNYYAAPSYWYGR